MDKHDPNPCEDDQIPVCVVERNGAGAQLCLHSLQRADLHSPLPGKKACAADCEFVGVGKEI